MNINSTRLDANINAAARCSNEPYITVRPIHQCGGCNADAVVMVQGRYPRCQSCANKLVNVWNEMRVAKNASRSQL